MNGFKNWSVIPARTWRIRQADEGDGWLKIPAIPIPVGELTPAEDQKEAIQPAPARRRKLLRRSLQRFFSRPKRSSKRSRRPRLRRPSKRPRKPRPKSLPKRPRNPRRKRLSKRPGNPRWKRLPKRPSSPLPSIPTPTPSSAVWTAAMTSSSGSIASSTTVIWPPLTTLSRCSVAAGPSARMPCVCRTSAGKTIPTGTAAGICWA